MQHDRPAHYPLDSSAAQLHQQENQLRQYTLATMSAREHDRERGRLSPDPHLEIMRPVSPFQNKRQLAHQQGQAQVTTQIQQQNEQRFWKPPQQSHSGSQAYTRTRPSRTQEVSQSSTSTSSTSNSSTRAIKPSSRARKHGSREDSRGTRAAQRDVDISPALKMMDYDTNYTPPSSEQGHGHAGTQNTSGSLAPPERSDVNRSTSPEGSRKKNPRWRKPVPKYIPTPPSTPPTATFDRLPSTRRGEESIPPVPVHSTPNLNAQANRPRVQHENARSELVPPPSNQTPPARPVRTATDYQVPVHFRDLTASRARFAGLQQPAQVHTRSTRTPRGLTTLSQNIVQTPSSSSVQASATSQVQVPAAQVPAQAHTIRHDGKPQPNEIARSNSTSLRHAALDDQTETRRAMLAHPQPRKVPSVSKLVAMVLPSRSPSRTPSPGIPPTTREISGPLPLNSVPPAKASIVPALAETSQTAAPNLSIPPIAKKETSTVTLSSALLHPEHVHLPPSGSASVTSSRSVSPQPSPPRVTAPLPAASCSGSPQPSPGRVTAPLPANPRPRSPSPAVIPQYPPPPPPFPPPPPNTPIAAPALRASVLLQSSIGPRPAEKSGSVKERVSPEMAPRVTNTSSGDIIVFETTDKVAQVPEASTTPRTTPAQRDKDASVGSQSQAGPVKLFSKLGPEVIPDNDRRKENVAMTNWRSSAPAKLREDHTLPQASVQAKGAETRIRGISTEDQNLGTSVRERSPSPQDLRRKVMQIQNSEPKEMIVQSAVVAAVTCEKEIARDEKREASVTPKLVASVVRNAERSPSPLSGYRPRPPVQGAREPENTAEEKLTSAPMTTRSEISRESGLVTPPTTPPGTLTSAARDEHVCSRTEESSLVKQRSDAEIGRAARSVKTVQLPADDASLVRAAVQSEGLVQDEKPQIVDEAVIHGTKSNIRPITTFFTPESSLSSANVLHEDVSPPPDWKESITRAVRSNATPSPPTLPLVQAESKSEISSAVKPEEHSHEQSTRPTEEVPAFRYVTRRLPIEETEHATTALDLHIHEAETSDDTTTSQSYERKVIDIEEKRKPLSSSTFGHQSDTLAKERAPKAISAVKHWHNDELPSQSSSLDLPIPEVPIRSRSPVPRRKAPQLFKEMTGVSQKKTDEELAIVSAPETLAPSLLSAIHPDRRPAELSSRSHSSSSRRKGKSSRARSGNDGRNASTVRTEQSSPDNVDRRLDAGVSTPDDPSLDSLSLPAECSSPPRNQLLGNRKRLPIDRSETNTTQTEERDVARDAPSPPAPPRPLPCAAQSQAPPRPQRHPHGHHKRLPAPEVTQQAYRPPTPPIPSHYRKKRSHDLLPAEPPTFMKPAVHVIYPDTSTSHGQSLSSDTIFNLTNSKSSGNKNHGQTGAESNTMLHKEDRARPQSPSPSDRASLERHEDEDEVPEISPQVPPKAQRIEVNKHDSPFSNDRLSNLVLQHATHGQIRYPSAPVGLTRAHMIMLPPDSNRSRNRSDDRVDGSSESHQRPRRTQPPYAAKAARSQSEKLFKKKETVPPVARSRSTPIPSSRQRSRRGFWRIFGLWARVFMAKFRTWTTPAPPANSQSSEYGGYYDTY